MLTLRTNKNIRIIAAICSIIIGSAIGTLWYRHDHAATAIAISAYNPTRDKANIVNLFTIDRFWLTANPEFDSDYVLDTGSPNKYEPQYTGKMKTDVLYVNNTFAGFTSYFPYSFYEGKILFVAVSPEMRGKHYGEILVNHATDQLKKMGLQKIFLATRKINKRARILYTRVGFTETEGGPEDDFTYFHKWMK